MDMLKARWWKSMTDKLIRAMSAYAELWGARETLAKAYANTYVGSAVEQKCNERLDKIAIMQKALETFILKELNAEVMGE